MNAAVKRCLEDQGGNTGHLCGGSCSRPDMCQAGDQDASCQLQQQLPLIAVDRPTHKHSSCGIAVQASLAPTVRTVPPCRKKSALQKPLISLVRKVGTSACSEAWPTQAEASLGHGSHTWAGWPCKPAH